ncbi:MAG: hydroxyethylthiazole kinase [Deltaproteobacteria bacterium]|jgi:hydroxyethylthiazole kinase|nr:hydroxyethylthiazole kinase [Deltaproteobacteria bacterium]
MMNPLKLSSYLKNVKSLSPLVLCLTNFVTVSDCANALLAIGASPVMSQDPQDASDLAAISSSLVLNIGSLNEQSDKVMAAAHQAALKVNKPIVLDPVGAGATNRRLKACETILANKVDLIRANASEVLALAGLTQAQKGVDSSAAESLEFIIEQARALSKSTKALVVATGETDAVVSHDREPLLIKGGTILLTKLTGTGCLLSAIVGAYAAANPLDLPFAAAAALRHLAKAGELAEKALENKTDLGTFKTLLFDHLAGIHGDDLDG